MQSLKGLKNIQWIHFIALRSPGELNYLLENQYTALIIYRSSSFWFYYEQKTVTPSAYFNLKVKPAQVFSLITQLSSLLIVWMRRQGERGVPRVDILFVPLVLPAGVPRIWVSSDRIWTPHLHFVRRHSTMISFVISDLSPINSPWVICFRNKTVGNIHSKYLRQNICC